MEEKKHKKRRIKEVSDSKDVNKVDHDKAAVDSEVGEVISSVNHKKRKRKGEGSGSDVGNAAEERKKKKKTKHIDNLVEAEQEEVAERKSEEEVLVKKDDDKKEKEGKRKKKKEVVDGQNGGIGDQAEKDRKKKKKRKHKEDLVNRQETGERESELGNDSKIERERKREKKKNKKDKADHTPTIEEGKDKHVESSDQSEERKKKKKKKHKNKDNKEVGEEENAENVKENRKSKKKKPTLPSKKGKRVTFADDVQVFPATDEEEEEERDKSARNRGIVHSKRFSPEEDKLVKEAVFKFIESRDLGEEGLDMVLHCKDHPEVRNCWREIGSYIPWRPYTSVYHRAHTIFKRSEISTWSPEECEIIRNFHEKHGPDWKTLAEALGRHRVHVKDTWRRIKMENAKKGAWSEDEYKILFESVNMDLRMRSLEDKPFNSRHGMLRDNIPWEAISEKLSTRNNALCCTKWYKQLTSPMVSMGMWDDTDDYCLLDALVFVDACSMEDVDWDSLIENRSGDVCRKRWYQMVNQLGDQGSKSFPELVDILSNRYCPELIDAREAWDEKLREANEAKTDDD